MSAGTLIQTCQLWTRAERDTCALCFARVTLCARHATRAGRRRWRGGKGLGLLTNLQGQFSSKLKGEVKIFRAIHPHTKRNWWDCYSIVAHSNFSNLSNFNFYHFMTLHDNKARFWVLTYRNSKCILSFGVECMGRVYGQSVWVECMGRVYGQI